MTTHPSLQDVAYASLAQLHQCKEKIVGIENVIKHLYPNVCILGEKLILNDPVCVSQTKKKECKLLTAKLVLSVPSEGFQQIGQTWLAIPQAGKT